MVFKKKPDSFNKPKIIVKNFFVGLEMLMIKNSASSILQKMELCVKNGGSRLESELY